jgi:hypothetical protein
LWEGGDENADASEKKSTNRGKHQLMVTLCHTHDSEDKIKNRNAWSDTGVDVSINRRMIKTWYVYQALMKLVNGAIEVDEHEESNIRLINRDEFVHSKSDIPELTTITIDPDDPEDAIAQTWPHLITGSF